MTIAASLFAISSCVTTPPDLSHEFVKFKTLLPATHPLLRSTLLLFGEKNGEFSFCNAVYVGEGKALTSGHCIFDGFNYWVFVPKTTQTEDPFTEIDMVAVRVDWQRRHASYKMNTPESFVEYDLAVLNFTPPKETMLKAASLDAQMARLTSPKSLAWREGAESHFAVEPQNTVSISGFRADKDKILGGVFETNDVASYIGKIPASQSLLISLNPGTSIHSGVSGSGVFVQRGDQYVLVGLVSHYVPGMNLLAAADVTNAISQFKAWDDEAKKAKKTQK